jgi:chloramphenicol-sensitive protein RarD
MKESTRGALTIFFVYAFWGVLPVYWKAIESVDSVEILAHRMVWSCIFSFILVAVLHKKSVIISLFRSNRRALALLLLSGVVVTANWGLYIWAVNHGRILESSLGYFINPLISILFGLVIFKEKLNKIQWLAIGIAATGVCSEIIALGHLPFISLSLAILFSTYSIIKKLSAVESLAGFTVETVFMTPFALAYLIWCQYSGTAHFPYEMRTTLLLIGTGVITAAPLILFTWGVKRSAMTTVGLIQYTSPILIFITGTFVYNEPVTPVRLLSFVLIWVSIIIFTVESFWRTKRTGKS